MSILDPDYPRVETIEVPENVKPEYVGCYVSAWVSKFLIDLGQINYNRKSLLLRPIGNNGYLWALSFNTSVQYGIPQGLDIYRSNSDEYEVMEEIRLAPRNKSKSSKDK